LEHNNLSDANETSGHTSKKVKDKDKDKDKDNTDH